MKLTLHTFQTLDGVMQGPGGPDEDRSGGFERGGWVGSHVDDAFGRIVGGWFEQAEAFLLGRTTYDLFNAYWPKVDDQDNIAAVKLNSLPKIVVSSTLTDPDWDNTTVISGDLVAAVTELKERPGGELQVHGSAQLAASLHEAGLVDEYRLLTFPVSLGSGKRLLVEGARPSDYEVLRTEVTSAGVVYSELAPKPFSVTNHEVVDGKDTVTEL